MYTPAGDYFTAEGPDRNTEIRIIGVELAIREPTGQETELEIFPCKHTIKRNHYHSESQIRVTLHCSDGDRTLILHTRI
jgi:hypothetical protein